MTTTTTTSWLADSNSPAAKNARTAIVLGGTTLTTVLAWVVSAALAH